MPVNRIQSDGANPSPDRQDFNLTSGDGVLITQSDDATNYVSRASIATRGPGVWSVYIPLAQLANAQTYTFTPGVAGRIKSVRVTVVTAATTAAKLATLTAKIATVATTGGVVALTSANCTPIGAEVAGTAVTALNTFTALEAISIDVSAVTTFVEGAIMVNVMFA